MNSKHDDVRGAAAAWGGPTHKNGITVTFKSQAQVDADAGNTDPNTKVGAMVGPVPNGSHTPEISAEFSESLGGSDLRQAIAHEGSHTEDDMLFLRCNDPSTGTSKGSLDFTHLTSEIWAYQIGAEVKPYSFYKEWGFSPATYKFPNEKSCIPGLPQYTDWQSDYLSGVNSSTVRLE